VRILFISSTRIGDAVLSTGLLGHLMAQYPSARFTLACGPAAEGVFARMPGLERLWVLRKRKYSLHWLGLWWFAVRRRWDLVVDLRGSAMVFMLPTRARALMRGGRRAGHRLAHLAEILRLSPPPLPLAWFNAADTARTSEIAGPFLALGPSANWHYKVWPAERFVALARALTGPGGALAGHGIVILGGPGEAEAAMVAPVLAALPGAVDMVGKLTLPEAAALLSRASLYIGNDSGLMHLAAAAAAPTLGLFGPTNAEEYAPSGPHARVVEADRHVSPPGATELEKLARMDALPMERALAAATALLSSVPAA
jgi:ADP-heptose:LPS heptosyltransferase